MKSIFLLLNLFLVGKVLNVNITVHHYGPEYFPNCNLITYLWLNNNLVNFTKLPIEILPYSHPIYNLSFNLNKYKSGNLTVESYISCERLNLYGNHIAFQGGTRKTIFYNGTGEIPKVVIDKDKTRIVGARGQAGPKIEPGKRIYLDIDLKALDDFEGYLIINLCKWDNVIYRNTCKKVYERELKLKKSEEKMYRIFLNFPRECDAYNYEILLMDKNGNVHDIWTLRGVTKCSQLHYVYTYFKDNETRIIFTGPYDPNWGYGYGKIKIISDNYSKEFDVKIYTNKIKELILPKLSNFCIYVNNTLIKCMKYNLTKFEERIRKMNEIIEKYLKEMEEESNVTEKTNATVNKAVIKKVQRKINWTIYAILGVIVFGLAILFRKVKS